MYFRKDSSIAALLSGIKSGAMSATGLGGRGMSKDVYAVLSQVPEAEFELVSLDAGSEGYWKDDDGSGRTAVLPSFTATVKQGSASFTAYLDFASVYSLVHGGGKSTLSVTKATNKDNAPVLAKGGQLKGMQILNFTPATTVQLDADGIAKACTQIEVWYESNKVKVPAGG